MVLGEPCDLEAAGLCDLNLLDYLSIDFAWLLRTLTLCH
jgi:hypothetical protein